MVFVTTERVIETPSFHLTIVTCQLMTCGSVLSQRSSRLLKGLFRQK